MARRPLNLPSQSSGAGRLRFSPPQSVPGVSAETQRALLDAFQSIQQELARLSAPFVRVPLLDDVQETRDGQVVRGVGGGQVLVLPNAPAFFGVRVVLDEVTSAVTVVEPDSTEHTLSVPGVYDFVPASDDGETYETAPEVTLDRIVDAPGAGFIGATAAGPYEHRTVAQAAAAFASASVVVSGDELQRAAVSGDVSIPQDGNTATIPAGTVSNAQTASMAEARIKGRPDGAGAGPQQDMTPAEAAAIVAPELRGRLIAVTTYTAAASGTHTFDAAATSAEVTLVGGGGGGGGTLVGGARAPGGGAGAFHYAYVPAGSLPASMAYTVGAGGAGGTSIPLGAGAAGAASTVTISASVHSAGGGAGGAASLLRFAPGAGGVGTSGTFTELSVRGGAGGVAETRGGFGGDSAFGGGGLTPDVLPAAGVAGVSGGGGSGGSTIVGPGVAGGAGGAGLIIVKEYA